MQPVLGTDLKHYHEPGRLAWQEGDPPQGGIYIVLCPAEQVPDTHGLYLAVWSKPCTTECEYAAECLKDDGKLCPSMWSDPYQSGDMDVLFWLGKA